MILEGFWLYISTGRFDHLISVLNQMFQLVEKAGSLFGDGTVKVLAND
jgi:hypothetical protein